MDFIHQQQWLVFDDRYNRDHQQLASALNYQEAMIRWVAQLNDSTDQTDQNQATPTGLVHFYPTAEPAILLGRKDLRLPNLEAAIDYLHQQNYALTVRPHGGLGIVCDPGILNVALVTDQRVRELSIDQAYQQMVDWVASALKPAGLEVTSYEIPNSYCPGAYDLVVDGQKIGGIAQRRFKTGVTTAAYLSVTGDQEQRALTMQRYYTIGQADETYPQVDPAAMTTISQLTQSTWTLEQLQEQLLAVLRRESTAMTGNFDDEALRSLYHDRQKHNARQQRTL